MCGVVGVHAPGQDAAGLAALGLFALQHRGQESAGLAVSDGRGVMVYKDLGLVDQVLDERRLQSLRGELASAHCRYSTTGSTIWENSQPALRMGPTRTVAVSHNGNLVNTQKLLEALPGGRARLVGTTDTELLTALIALEPAADLVDALLAVLPRVSGAYSLIVSDETRVVGVRDPYGFRPLVLGALSGDDNETAWILASETAALDVISADFVRDVEPGEMVVLGEPAGPRSVRFAAGKEQLCVFELIYFARPDSYMLGRNLYEVRRRMGEMLARGAGRGRPGHARARHRGRRGGGLCRGNRHPVPRGHGSQPLRGTNVHPAQHGHAPARRDGQAFGAARAGSRTEAGSRG